MTEDAARFDRHADWHKRRRGLPWPEKIRIAESLRDDIEALRRREPRLRDEKAPASRGTRHE